MEKRALAAVLALSLLLAGALLAQQRTRETLAATSAPASTGTPTAQAATPAQQPQSVRPRSRVQRRSYARETRVRRRSGISKKEVAFMAAIAGTSMGIGALAGGARGLAVGAIVGGWGAYAGHRLWNWVK